MPPHTGHSPDSAIMHRYWSRSSTAARTFRHRLVLPLAHALLTAARDVPRAVATAS